MKPKITKQDFQDYEFVRCSGITNMFDVNTVIKLSKNLTKEKCFEIMEYYEEYKQEFENEDPN